jgi:hypothetical protein
MNVLLADDFADLPNPASVVQVWRQLGFFQSIRCKHLGRGSRSGGEVVFDRDSRRLIGLTLLWILQYY